MKVTEINKKQYIVVYAADNNVTLLFPTLFTANFDIITTKSSLGEHFSYILPNIVQYV